MSKLFGLFGGRETSAAGEDNSSKRIRIDPNRCPQNHLCPSIRVCPVGALTQEGVRAPKADMDKCIRCGKCVKFCPMRAISLE